MMKRLLIVALTATAAACGGGSGSSSGTGGSPTTPTTPTNRAPVITAVSVSPAFGVSGVTNFNLSATANDPDGDALSYNWNFGSATASGPTIGTRISGDGAVAVRLTVQDAKGAQATDSRNVTIGNMTGRWNFIYNGGCSAAVPPVLVLTQNSTIVTGTIESPGPWCGVPAGAGGKLDPAAPASIDGNGKFSGARLKIEGFLDAFLDGQMDGSGRTITGSTRFTNNATGVFEMRKQ